MKHLQLYWKEYYHEILKMCIQRHCIANTIKCLKEKLRIAWNELLEIREKKIIDCISWLPIKSSDSNIKTKWNIQYTIKDSIYSVSNPIYSNYYISNDIIPFPTNISLFFYNLQNTLPISKIDNTMIPFIRSSLTKNVSNTIYQDNDTINIYNMEIPSCILSTQNNIPNILLQQVVSSSVYLPILHIISSFLRWLLRHIYQCIYAYSINFFVSIPYDFPTPEILFQLNSQQTILTINNNSGTINNTNTNNINEKTIINKNKDDIPYIYKDTIILPILDDNAIIIDFLQDKITHILDKKNIINLHPYHPLKLKERLKLRKIILNKPSLYIRIYQRQLYIYNVKFQRCYNQYINIQSSKNIIIYLHRYAYISLYTFDIYAVEALIDVFNTLCHNRVSCIKTIQKLFKPLYSHTKKYKKKYIQKYRYNNQIKYIKKLYLSYNDIQYTNYGYNINNRYKVDTLLVHQPIDTQYTIAAARSHIEPTTLQDTILHSLYILDNDIQITFQVLHAIQNGNTNTTTLYHDIRQKYVVGDTMHNILIIFKSILHDVREMKDCMVHIPMTTKIFLNYSNTLASKILNATTTNNNITNNLLQNFINYNIDVTMYGWLQIKILRTSINTSQHIVYPNTIGFIIVNLLLNYNIIKAKKIILPQCIKKTLQQLFTCILYSICIQYITFTSYHHN